MIFPLGEGKFFHIVDYWNPGVGAAETRPLLVPMQASGRCSRLIRRFFIGPSSRPGPLAGTSSRTLASYGLAKMPRPPAENTRMGDIASGPPIHVPQERQKGLGVATDNVPPSHAP